jgi:tellurite resistance-related uncharacterized protein
MPKTLRELAEDIARMEASGEGMIAYTMPGGGVCNGQWLFTEPPGEGWLHPGGCVQVCRMQAGQVFEPHVQDYGVSETLHCICGQLEVTTFEDDAETVKREVVLAPGDSTRLWPGELHQAAARTDVVVVGITVPRDGGYPDGPQSVRNAPGGVCEEDG